MGIDESDITRLLAGDVSNDDAQLGQVSAFLGDLKAAYPPSSVSALEDRHLAVVAREVRTVGASRVRDHRDAQRSRKRLRRTVAAFGAGVLVVLTAGVGVASAMGLNPLELVPGLVAKPSATPDAPARTPGSAGNSQQVSHGAQPPSADPSVPPTTTGQPSASPSPTHGTPGNCGNGKGAGNATCTKGNSGKDNSGNGKSKGKSGNGNSGSSTAGSGASGSKGNGNPNKATPSAAPTDGNGNGNGKAKGKDKSAAEAGASTQP